MTEYIQAITSSGDRINVSTYQITDQIKHHNLILYVYNIF